MVHATVMLYNSAKEEVKLEEKAHEKCEVEMDQIWCDVDQNCNNFMKRTRMALDVLFDFMVLNIAMVHAIIMQVDITMEEVKEAETAEECWKMLKWIKSNPTLIKMGIIL